LRAVEGHAGAGVKCPRANICPGHG
jgi:hypothetical protein